MFLEPAVLTSYRRLVQHEEDVRDRLINHIESGLPLSEFRRVFLLHRTLRPTRQSVIDIDYARPNFAQGWCAPASPHVADVAQNIATVRVYVDCHAAEFAGDDGHPDRQDHQRHLVARGVPLAAAYAELLTALQPHDFEDSQRWTVALIMIVTLLVVAFGALTFAYGLPSKGRRS